MPLTDYQVELLAQKAHELNRSYCQTLGDNSQPPWARAPEWQRESARKGVRFVEAVPQADDSASHNSWMRQKTADGWVYGPVKDPEKKEHPCMVPYEQLPQEQQFKDRLFRTVVLAGIETCNNEE